MFVDIPSDDMRLQITEKDSFQIIPLKLRNADVMKTGPRFSE